jgi:hypothetical protein
MSGPSEDKVAQAAQAGAWLAGGFGLQHTQTSTRRLASLFSLGTLSFSLPAAASEQLHQEKPRRV